MGCPRLPARNGTYEWPVHRAAFPRKRAGPGIRPPPAPQPFPRSSPHTTEAAGHGTPPGSPHAHDGPGRPAHRPSCGVSRRSWPGRWRREAPPAKRWPRSATGAHEGSEPATAGPTRRSWGRSWAGREQGPGPAGQPVGLAQRPRPSDKGAAETFRCTAAHRSGAPARTLSSRSAGPGWLPLLPRSGPAAPVDGAAQCRVRIGCTTNVNYGFVLTSRTLLNSTCGCVQDRWIHWVPRVTGPRRG